jgi:hypothetical protein
VSTSPLQPIFPLKKFVEEFHYTRQHLLKLEREGQIPPFLRRHKRCRVFGTEEHRRALAGRLGIETA